MRGTRRCSFDPWVRKIPWRRKWQPTPVFLPGKSYGQRSLEGYSPWGRKELDTTEQRSVSTSTAHWRQGGSAKGKPVYKSKGRMNGKAGVTPLPSSPRAASLEGAASPLWVQHQLGTPPWLRLPPGRPQLLDSTLPSWGSSVLQLLLVSDFLTTTCLTNSWALSLLLKHSESFLFS